MHTRILLPLFALAAMSACASPEQKLRMGLMDAGLSPNMAGCMAERMVDRLSLVQLRRLSSLSKIKESDLRQLSIEEFLYKVRALKDPEILTITTKAGLGCAIGL